jgi:flagellar motor switch protein FliG
MSNARLNNRTHAVALMAVLHEGEKALNLMEFVGEADRTACEERVEAILGSDDGRKAEAISLKLRALTSSEKFSGIAEIHPAWILEALKDESPRIIGIIMRYLPSKQVRYVLEHLPKETREKIPTLLEAFAVPQHVLDIIRSRFESRFLPIHISKSQDEFGFEHLYYLKGEELETLCVELGLWEMAMALSGVSDKMLRVLLNRLDLKDAKRLHEKIKELKGVSKELKSQARYAILESEAENVGSRQLLMEVGLASLARAMAADDDDRLFALIRQKVSPHFAYALRREIVERSSGISPEAMEDRRALILKCISSLAEEERIDGQWARFSSRHAA